MMGTGEASGEKRALEAAEAAIANPLLDDVSMKGAKGLLISITGGNDLTLYEVDEAATRIREEVDTEANIILGATFDESLDGVIRVSVVATGIAADTFVTMPEEERAGRLAAIGGRRPYVINDRPSFAAARRPAETVSAGVAAAEEERYDEPEQIEAPEPEMAPAAMHPAPVEERYEAAPVVRRDPPAPPRREAPPTAFYDTLPDHPVAPQQRPDDHAMRRDEIAGASRRMPPRMPDVDDFPPIAVREMQARSGHGDEIGLHAQKKRVGFLERLANVGIGFRDPVVTSNKHREPSVSTQFGAEGPNQRSEAHRRAEHAAQQAAAGAAHHPDFDEDQLEIPAFLRRQAN
jgi:cell division protein FtsZ